MAVYNESSDSYQTYVESTNTLFIEKNLFQHNQIFSIQKSNQSTEINNRVRDACKNELRKYYSSFFSKILH